MGLRTIEAERVGRAGAVGRVEIRIIVEEVSGEAVDAGRVRGGREGRFARRVGRVGISTKIMVKGFVLPENDNDVFDRGGGGKRVLRRYCECREFAVGGKRDRQAKGEDGPANVAWHEVLSFFWRETKRLRRKDRSGPCRAVGL